mmetsp:Transcript_24845/g.37302  ORF Transcript_24845/g.37302 Transcript_24845/m.37302 type:complete len:372 (+) Transcript_24845:105-1220(+)
MHRICFLTIVPSYLMLLAFFPAGVLSRHQSTVSNLCDTDGSSAYWSWDTESDPDFVLIVSNLCPDTTIENAIGDNTNYALIQSNMTFWLPKVPVWRDNIAADNDLNLYAEGAQGISISNVAIYGPATGPTGGDAGDDEIDTFDWCGAHADPDGIHHYHTAPYCTNLAANATPVGTILNPSALHSPLWGWAPDGFAIYGPYGDNGTAPTDLDDCQGHYNDSGAGGGYHYHYNAGPMGTYPQDSNEDGGYPYFQACIRGCVPNNHTLYESLALTDYDSCVASSSAAPAGNYSKDFWDTFTPLNYSCVALGTCTSAPTQTPTTPTQAPTPSPTVSIDEENNDLSSACSLKSLWALRKNGLLLLGGTLVLAAIYY